MKDALAYIPPPSQGWKNWEDCGIEFTCTGLYNAAFKFIEARWPSGSVGLPNSFDIVSNNVESVSVTAFEDGTCELVTAWNAWLCDRGWGIMIFDSLDEDRLDRNVAPIYIKNNEFCNRAGACFKNRLNAFMDNCWDGFYTCQQREQRFPTHIWNEATYYDIDYTGTPPKNQMFRLFGDSTGFIVRIYYSTAESFKIIKDGQAVS